LAYTIKTYRIESELKSKSTDSLSDTTYFQVTYPQFEDKAINTYIQSLLVFNDNPDTSFNNIEEVGKAFINSYEDFQKKEVSSPWAWYSNIQAHVVENNPSYVSIEVNYDDFMGGAHGNHGTIFSNYNLSSKRQIELNDIISNDSIAAFIQIAKDIFIKQEEIDGKEKTFDNFFFENGEFSLNNNFLLKEKSILYLYNVYEIKPYSDGTTKLEIPYNKIMSLLSEEGKNILRIK